ncbi:helix-turn-helix domain-containing protein [Paenibacillus daejeonensis]|uniref:helix-turn-helix domain-containing protein n=1 Tax=Paenibacillus daejeonensis TaxID=135193 RepID=UPI00036AD3BD|nr:helix-turn-helix transcriptional regulator [Paenibacillus daejeonensis]
MNFPQRLRELRESRGLSQEDLAEILGIPRSSITHYEQEDQDRLPRRKRLEQIADYFKVKIDYLLGRDNEKEDSAIVDEESFRYEAQENKTESILREIVKKYDLDLTNPGEKEKLERIIEIVTGDSKKK